MSGFLRKFGLGGEKKPPRFSSFTSPNLPRNKTYIFGGDHSQYDQRLNSVFSLIVLYSAKKNSRGFWIPLRLRSACIGLNGDHTVNEATKKISGGTSINLDQPENNNSYRWVHGFFPYFCSTFEVDFPLLQLGHNPSFCPQ